MQNVILLFVVFFYLLASGVATNLALCCSCASVDIQDTFIWDVSIYILYSWFASLYYHYSANLTLSCGYVPNLPCIGTYSL